MMWRLVMSAAILVSAGQIARADEPENERTTAKKSKPDASYGTALQWESNINAAKRKAERQRKLVMVLAVAGHFEDPFFT